MARLRTAAFVVAIAAACFFVISSPAHAYKKAKISHLVAPKHDLEGVNQITILDLKETDRVSRGLGRYFADQFIKFLISDSQTENIPYVSGITTAVFTVTERSRLDAVLAEQSIGQSGLIEDAQAAKIGAMLGTDAIVGGEISAEETTENFTETYQVKQGDKWVDQIVRCTKRNVNVTVSLRIVDTSSGAILATLGSSWPSEGKACEDSDDTLPSADDLARNSVTMLAIYLSHEIAPFWIVREAELHKTKADDVKDICKEGDEAIDDDGDYVKAYAMYMKAYEVDPYNPKILYNLGITYEAGFDYAKAREMYEASQMLKDDNKNKEALERVEQGEKTIAYYEMRGTPIQPFDFENATSGTDIATEKITVKGKSQDRCNVYAEPNTDSKVVGKVPGEIQLPVLAKEGDWYKVKLPVGAVKEGYIHKDNVVD